MRNSFFFAALLALSACTAKVPSSQVWVTSEAGDKCTEGETVVFHKGAIDGAIVVNPDEQRQAVDGFGGSLTESSAFVLACLPEAQRRAILEELYGEQGANFTVTRTQIGASDFSVEGKYSLAEADGDTAVICSSC